MEFKDLLQKYDLSITEFCQKFDVPFSTAFAWKQGYRKPNDWYIRVVELILERGIDL